MTAVLSDAGVVVLDRAHTILEIGEVEVGIVGTKGFVGGFPGAEIADFGEPVLRQVYRETTLEVEALELGLEAVAGCHKRIVLLHYAPTSETLVGEPEPIWAFLGSGRLAGADRDAPARTSSCTATPTTGRRAGRSARCRSTTSPCT